MNNYFIIEREWWCAYHGTPSFLLLTEEYPGLGDRRRRIAGATSIPLLVVTVTGPRTGRGG